MTKRDQKRFIKELAGNILAEITGQIEQGKLPPEWDGIELRQYLADKFGDAKFRMPLRGKRMMEYHNTVLERNL